MIVIEIEDTGIGAHIARKETDSPICLGGEGDAGLTLNIYWRKGEIMGVTVWSDTNLVGAVGLVAAGDIR